MRDAAVVMARPDGRDERMTSECVLSLAYGADENSFKLQTSPRQAPAEGWRVYVDGTSWGGVVDKVKSTTGRDGAPAVVCSGRTWHGILAGRRLRPDGGDAHLSVSGTIGSVLSLLVSRLGLGALFEAEVNEARITYDFERFTDAYSGIRAMLAANGRKLVLRSEQGRVVMCAPLAESIEVGGRIGVEIEKVHRCVNHLVCAGQGELEERVVVDLYADERGDVSETQTFFGLDEIEAFYDYTNADRAKLSESGSEKLSKMQSHGAVSVEFPDGIEAEVGDVLAGFDERLGVEASASVVKKVVKISGGAVSVSYEAGCENAVSTSNSTITGNAGSSGGGASYVAGDGITIEGGAISADVTKSDLDAVSGAASDARKAASDALAAAGKAQEAADGKAPRSHGHAPSDLTSPVPVANGGTGATTAAGALSGIGAAPKSHGHAKADIEDFPTSMPASDVSEWAKAPSKPAYTAAEVGAAPKSHGHAWGEVTGKPTAYPPASHSHPYAGAKSAGGAANSAEKLSTARTIAISGAVSGSAEFDGSENVTITVEGDTKAAGFLAAHPVGFYVECRAGVDPNAVGGVWEQVPSVGPCVWLRTK